MHILNELTSHAFGYGLVFAICSWIWRNVTLEVAPHSHVSEAFVEPAILEVLGGQNTSSARRIHQVIERYGTRATIFHGPSGRNRSSRVGQFVLAGDLLVLIRLEIDRLQRDILEGLCTTLSGVAKKNLVRFRSYHVPGISIRTVGPDEVCVCDAITLGRSSTHYKGKFALLTSRTLCVELEKCTELLPQASLSELAREI